MPGSERPKTRIRPGLRHLYLSIFDRGDRIYDFAVFIDKLIDRPVRARDPLDGHRRL